MPNYLLKFGSYTFPAGFSPSHRELPNVVPVLKLPRYYGARSIQGSQDAARVTIKGGFIRGPIKTPGTTTIEAARDSLVYNLLTIGGPSDLYFGRDDRYYHNAQLERMPDDYTETGWGRASTIDLPFVCPDSHQHSVTLSSDTWTIASSGLTHTVTPGGTARAEPTLNITVSGSGAKTIAFTITNATTGTAFTLAGSVTGGDVIVVDSYNKTVTIGGVDKLSLFDGQWMTLAVGANLLSETYVTNALSQIVFQWRDRYL